MNNLVKSAAQGMAETNIRVNAICPGLIETGMAKRFYDIARATGNLDKMGILNPQRRGGNSAEVASVALFLSSDLTSYVSGEAIVVDGGLTSAIRKEMQEIAGKWRRFGYRRIGILLERKGIRMNHKKLYRIYREEGLSVKRRRGRKRARGTRTPMPSAADVNARWSLDFVSDSFGASRKFRILALIDDCTRECLCLVADTSLSGARVARELSALIRVYGKPGCIVSDNGTEFTSRAILKWADENSVPWH